MLIDEGVPAQAEALVDSLTSAETAEAPAIIDKLANYRRWADPILYRRLAETPPESKDLSCARAPETTARSSTHAMPRRGHRVMSVFLPYR